MLDSVQARKLDRLIAAHALARIIVLITDNDARLRRCAGSQGRELDAAMTWPATILTLYPEMFPGPLGLSLAGRALAEGIWSLDTVQIRDFATDRHRSVDDTPAGGGAGMVMRADVLAAARRQRRCDGPRADAGDEPARRAADPGPGPRRSPPAPASPSCAAASRGSTSGCSRRGRSSRSRSATMCSRAARPAALALLDACVRLLPGVMGAPSSGEEESFESGLLEYPHYTRPVEWEGRRIPEVLRSGDHAKIAAWRKAKGGGRNTAKAAGPDRASRGRAKAIALWRAAREEQGRMR